METFADGRIMLRIGRVARLTLNRPEKRNAMNSDMWRAVISACEVVAHRPEVRALVLDGAGQHFCSGADISEFELAYGSKESAESYNNNYRAAENAVRGLDVPVIAEIRGGCFGGGLGLGLSADFRFADRSTKIAVTASKLGIAYSAEDSTRLIEKVGPIRTKDMLFSARTIEAAEALAWGLVDRLFEPEELSSGVRDYADLLAARSLASISAMKTIIGSLMEPNAKLCQSLRPIYSGLFGGPDFIEGRRAFLEKREPDFGNVANASK